MNPNPPTNHALLLIDQMQPITATVINGSVTMVSALMRMNGVMVMKTAMMTVMKMAVVCIYLYMCICVNGDGPKGVRTMYAWNRSFKVGLVELLNSLAACVTYAVTKRLFL